GVEDPLGEALLAVDHHRVHELRHQPIVVLGIGENFSALDFALAWHAGARLAGRRVAAARRPRPRRDSLRSFRSVLRAALPPILDADRIEGAADDVIAHAREVLHPPAPDEHDRMLLEVVPDPG